MSIFAERRNKLFLSMQAHGIAAGIFTPSTDFRYLTGSKRTVSQRISALVITASNSYLMLPDFEVENEPLLSAELVCVPYSDAQDPLTCLLSLLPSKGTVMVGQALGAGLLLSLQSCAKNLKWESASPLLDSLRSIKDPVEISIIETAQHMAEEALSDLLKTSLIGLSEKEISMKLKQLRLERGFDAVGDGIIAIGSNAALPHHINGERVLQKDDIIMFDIGGTYKGYKADFTRTFAVGRASEEFSEVYQIVLEAHLAGKAAAMPGVPAYEVDCAARKIIEKAGYGSYFTHRLGHGIGLDTHEAPFIAATNQKSLLPGNVFSCEPGIYLPGRFGIRIEDLLLLEETGARSLNKLPKELTILYD